MLTGQSLSLRAFALGAAARLCTSEVYARRPETSFLSRYAEVIPPNAGPEELAAYLADPVPVDRALADVGREIALTAVEMLAIETAIAVEDDLMAGRAIAMLQAPLGGSRPTIGLMAAMFTGMAGESSGMDLLGN